MADITYTFKDGLKYGSDGSVSHITHIKETPSSNKLGKYYTCLWSDGYLSCDCPGWAFKRKGKDRDCKHCKTARKVNYRDMEPAETFNAAAAPVAKRREILSRQIRARRAAMLQPTLLED